MEIMGNKKQGTARSNPNTQDYNTDNEAITFKLLKRLVTNAGTPEQRIYRVYQVKQGKEVREVRLSASDLTRQASLEEKLLNEGELHNVEGLIQLKKKIKNADDGNAITINEVEGMGFVPTFNCWVFSNAVLNNEGERLAYDKENKCYILDNGERIVKKEGRYKEAVINTEEPDIQEIKELIQKVIDARGGDIAFILMLGFVYASIKSNLIYDTFGYFPILFVSGDRSSGKSSLIRLALSSIGYRGAGDSNDSTPIGINRQLANTFSLPYWVDEYRNDREGRKHEANIRRVYDRQTRTKGQKSLDNETIQTEINGTLIFSGQAEITDTATRSRLIAIQLKEKDRVNRELFQEVDTQEGRDILSGLARLMIANKNINDDELLKRFKDGKKLLEKELIGGVADIERLSSNYALAYVFSGLLLELVGIDQNKVNLFKRVTRIMLREKEIADGIDTLTDLFTCANNPEMLNSRSGWLIAKKDDQILLKPEAITLYKEHKKRIDEPTTLDTNAIKELLRVKVDAINKQVKIAKENKRYWAFPLNKEFLNRYEILKDVTEALSVNSVFDE